MTTGTAEAVDLFQNTQAALNSAVIESIKKIAVDAIGIIPGLIAGAILLAVGWVIATAVSKVIEMVLKLIKFESILEEHKMKDALGKVKVSNVLVKLTKYYLLLIFLQAAVVFLNLGTISSFLAEIITYAPKLIGAALLVVVGALVGELAKEKIVEIEPKSTKMGLLAKWAKYLVVFVAIIEALDLAGFKVGVIVATYTILLQGIVFGAALAGAIAFGLGAQDEAKSIVKDLRAKLLKH